MARNIDGMKEDETNVFSSFNHNGEEKTHILSPKAQMAFAKSASNFYSTARSASRNRTRAGTQMSNKNGGDKGAKTHEDEEKILLGQTKTVDSAQVTHDVLKVCGVFRDKVQMSRQYLRSGEGIGGGDHTFYRRNVQLPQSVSSPGIQINLPRNRVTSTRNAKRDFIKLFASASDCLGEEAVSTAAVSKK